MPAEASVTDGRVVVRGVEQLRYHAAAHIFSSPEFVNTQERVISGFAWNDSALLYTFALLDAAGAVKVVFAPPHKVVDETLLSRTEEIDMFDHEVPIRGRVLEIRSPSDEEVARLVRNQEQYPIEEALSYGTRAEARLRGRRDVAEQPEELKHPRAADKLTRGRRLSKARSSDSHRGSARQE